MKDTAILTLNDFERIKKNARLQSKEEEENSVRIYNNQRECQYAKAKAFKQKLLDIDKNRGNRFEELNDIEKENIDKNNNLLSQAKKIMEQNEDCVKDMNHIVLYAKIASIRDRQLEEHKMMEKMYKRKESKLDLMMELERLKELKFQEEREMSRKVQQREDISNLIFLKQLNQLIASNKVKMFLQYLGNIDLKIRGFLIDLWESRDNNSFILILTEMKLFLKEMIDYYDEKKVTGFDLTYEVEKSQSKSVIHDIFFNDITLKVLYRLGLSDKRTVVIKGIEQEKFKFAINQIMNNKHRLFENFLSRFINIIKGTKVDPLDLEV